MPAYYITMETIDNDSTSMVNRVVLPIQIRIKRDEDEEVSLSLLLYLSLQYSSIIIIIITTLVRLLWLQLNEQVARVLAVLIC